MCQSPARGRPAELCPPRASFPRCLGDCSSQQTWPTASTGQVHTLLGVSDAIANQGIKPQSSQSLNPGGVHVQSREAGSGGGSQLSLREESRKGQASKDAVKCPPPQGSPSLQARSQGCTDRLEALTRTTQWCTHSQPLPLCTHTHVASGTLI